MASTPEELFRYFDEIGVESTTQRHDPVFTVDESRHLHETIAGAHTKNLFLWDRKSQFFLVTAQESTRIALNGLHRKLGAAGRLSFGSEEKMREYLGVTPGSVTPFGLVNDVGRAVRFILDPALAAADIINCHPLTNTMTTSIKMLDFRRFLEATGHPPLVLPLSD